VVLIASARNAKAASSTLVLTISFFAAVVPFDESFFWAWRDEAGGGFCGAERACMGGCETRRASCVNWFTCDEHRWVMGWGMKRPGVLKHRRGFWVDMDMRRGVG
jgi:hypothetical protein